jgi:hypothetical protein
MELDFPAQIAFDFVILHNKIPQRGNLRICQILNSRIGTDPGSTQDLPGPCWTDPVEIGQSDFHTLVARQVNSFDSRHNLLSLSLLMLRIVADDVNHASSLDDLAF